MKKRSFLRVSRLPLLLLLAIVFIGEKAHSQTVDPALIKAAIIANQWVFTADRSDPNIGRNSGLGTGYEVRCSGDTVVSVLPYAGSMQGPARFPESTGPLDFTSTDFKVSKVEKGNGKWMVTVRVRDHYDVNTLNFTFFENGKASLDVLPTNRTPIVFYGSVTPLQ